MCVMVTLIPAFSSYIMILYKFRKLFGQTVALSENLFRVYAGTTTSETLLMRLKSVSVLFECKQSTLNILIHDSHLWDAKLWTLFTEMLQDWTDISDGKKVEIIDNDNGNKIIYSEIPAVFSKVKPVLV